MREAEKKAAEARERAIRELAFLLFVLHAPKCWSGPKEAFEVAAEFVDFATAWKPTAWKAAKHA